MRLTTASTSRAGEFGSRWIRARLPSLDGGEGFSSGGYVGKRLRPYFQLPVVTQPWNRSLHPSKACYLALEFKTSSLRRLAYAIRLRVLGMEVKVMASCDSDRYMVGPEKGAATRAPENEASGHCLRDVRSEHCPVWKKLGREARRKACLRGLRGSHTSSPPWQVWR